MREVGFAKLVEVAAAGGGVAFEAVVAVGDAAGLAEEARGERETLAGRAADGEVVTVAGLDGANGTKESGEVGAWVDSGGWD